jgi:hypothetical protein
LAAARPKASTWRLFEGLFGGGGAGGGFGGMGGGGGFGQRAAAKGANRTYRLRSPARCRAGHRSASRWPTASPSM